MINKQDKSKLLDLLGVKPDVYDSLENYVLISNLNELSIGSYVRWVNIVNGELNKGGFITNIESNYIKVKKIPFSHVTVWYDENIIFEKLSSLEIELNKYLTRETK